MSFSINKNNYPRFKRTFEIIWGHQAKYISHYKLGIWSQNNSPIDYLNKIEDVNMSLAQKGLKAALKDVLIWLRDFPEKIKSEIDDELRGKNLPSLLSLWEAINNTMGKVLERKKIRSLEEFEIVKEFVDDLTSGISQKDRATLSKYLRVFEQKKNNAS